MCKVSVIIPVYNVERYIKETLESFINQTLRDIEIICVDDGSTDRTCEIINDYVKNDNRIKLFKQENKGAGVARNHGMKMATGTFMYFFDGDDYCDVTLLEKVVSKAEETNADIVVLDYYRVNEQTQEKTLYHGLNNSLYPKDKPVFNYKDVPNYILSIVNPTPWNKLYLREFVEGTGLEFMPLSTTNDITFCSLSVAMAERIAYVNEPLMYYRINRKASITSMKQKRLNNVLLAVEEVINRANALPYSDLINASIMRFSINNLLFALDNYAGRVRNKYYRKYYRKIHCIFNSDLYNSASLDTINNKNMYERFLEIKGVTYRKKIIGIVHKKIKKKIKTTCSKKNTCILKEVSKLSKQLNANKKQEVAIKQVVARSEKKIDELMSRINTLEKIISAQYRGMNKVEREKRIVVSLTSFPARINYVSVVLERLFVQSMRPDKIILWLSLDQFPGKEDDLPLELLEMKSLGLEIEWCEGDDKAYKKVLPALNKYKNDIIIIVDDDLVYDVDLISKLYRGHLKYPNAIIASRVHEILVNENGELLPYKKWPKEVEDYGKVSGKSWFFTGGAGTLLPPNVFKEEVFDYDTIKTLCPFADDIWLNIHAAINKAEVINVAANSHLSYVDGTQEIRLYDINKEQNDEQLKRVIEHYREQLKGSVYVK